MKVNHEWSVLCSQALLDKETNNLTLVNVIEQVAFDVQVPKGQILPEGAQIFPMNSVLISRIRKTTNDNETVSGKWGVKVLGPEKEIFGFFEKEFEMGSGIKNFRMKANIEGMKVTSSGVYCFEVSLKEGESDYEVVYSVPLEIKLDVKNID